MGVCIFHGEDEYSALEALQTLKQRLGPVDIVGTNTTSYDGATVSYGELAMACNTVPFLADFRVIVVQGLLELFQLNRPDGGQRPEADSSKKASSRIDAKMAEWKDLPGMVETMAPTTVLIMLSGFLHARNRMLPSLAKLGGVDVRTFDPMRGNQLEHWIKKRVVQHDGQISHGAVRLLASFVGGSLRRLDGEIEKLAIYAGNRTIDEGDVRLLISDAREAGIFTLVDAIIDGRQTNAIATLRTLMQQGAAVPYIVSMIARQLRLLVQMRSLKLRKAADGEMRRVLGTNSDFVIRKTFDQSTRFGPAQLESMYRKLLDADVAIKTGVMAEDVALETFVAEMAAPSENLRPSIFA